MSYDKNNKYGVQYGDVLTVSGKKNVLHDYEGIQWVKLL